MLVFFVPPPPARFFRLSSNGPIVGVRRAADGVRGNPRSLQKGTVAAWRVRVPYANPFIVITRRCFLSLFSDDFLESFSFIFHLSQEVFDRRPGYNRSALRVSTSVELRSDEHELRYVSV